MNVLKVLAYIKKILSEGFHGKIIITAQKGEIQHFEERVSRRFD